MTLHSYKRCLIVFLLLFFPVLVLSQFGDSLGFLKAYPILLVIISFARPMLSSCLLYLGIYAYISGVRTVHKLESPITITIVGAILTVISFGPPIVGYFMVHDLEKQTRSPKELRLMIDKSTDPSVSPHERLLTTRYYYLQTGERLGYLDANDETKVYSPSEVDKKDREYQAKLNIEVETVVRGRRLTVVVLGAYAIGSCLGFLLFLCGWTRTKTRDHV